MTIYWSKVCDTRLIEGCTLLEEDDEVSVFFSVLSHPRLINFEALTRSVLL